MSNNRNTHPIVRFLIELSVAGVVVVAVVVEMLKALRP